MLYAESPDNTAWFLLALRDGKIEIQFQNEFVTKITSGGKAINDGLWHIVSLFCQFSIGNPFVCKRGTHFSNLLINM